MTVSPSSETRNEVRHMDALPLGSRLAEFEILALLGVGGFGMVYKAFDHSLHRTVAIKEYMPATLATRAADGSLWARSSTDEPAFQAGLHSFVDEARMLAQFDHPSLVKVFRFWEAQNTAYMVMPLYHGMTLKQARAQMRTPPPEVWLRKVLWSVLSALRVLHDAKTLHRDISPDNIFLQDVGPPVLLDLGASRHAINDRDRKHTAVLKVNYAPIEQYSDGEGEGALELEQGPWSDLYSLGALVHGCLCNDTPLPATLRALRDRMVPFERVAKTVRKQFGEEYSAPFVNAVSQALKLQPEERPQSIDAFLALLQMSTPPAGMECFDFRTELDQVWVEPTDQPDPAQSVTTVDLTARPPKASLGEAAVRPDALFAGASAVAAIEVAPDLLLGGEELGDQEDSGDGPETVFLADERMPARDDASHGNLPVPVPPSSPSSRAVQATAGARTANGPEANASRSPSGLPSAAPPQKTLRKPTAWMLAGLAVLIVAAGAAAIGMRQSEPSGSAAALAPATATAQLPDAAPDAIITELKLPAAEPAQASADTRVVLGAGASKTPEISGPAPAFVLADDPRAAATLARTRSKKVPMALAAPSAETLPAEVAAPPVAARQASVPVVSSPRRAAPQPVLCADTNVLTRSSCLRAECASPVNRGLPVCLEYRKAMEPFERNNFAN